MWYDDYAARWPVQSAQPRMIGDEAHVVPVHPHPQHTLAPVPRAHVTDLVYYNDFGLDNALQRGYTYQDGNRVGAQMYPMFRWRVMPAVLRSR